MPELTLREVTELVGGVLRGAETSVITGVENLERARAKHAAFFADEALKSRFLASKAGCVLVRPGAEKPDKVGALIEVDDPDDAFTRLYQALLPRPTPPSPGVHPTAVVAPTVSLGDGVHVGPYVVLGENVRIGAGTVIHSHCVLMEGARVGKDCLLYSHCVLREFVVLGDRVLLQPGAVIGGDGFGYKLKGGELVQIPQRGIAELADDVHIGANSSVDRARFGKTLIGKGTKIDNLVQVAHNVRVGNSCGIAAMTGIAGSVVIEDFVSIGGGSGIGQNLTIGAGSTLLARAGADHSVPPGSTVYFQPMKSRREYFRDPLYLKRFPELIARIKRLEEAVNIAARARNANDAPNE